MCIPWTCGILQNIYQELCKNSQTLDTLNLSESKTEADTNPSQCFFNSQRISHPSTNLTLSQSEETLAQLSEEHDEREFPIVFISHISLTLNRNGAPWNKKPTVYIMQSRNGIITFREPNNSLQ